MNYYFSLIFAIGVTTFNSFLDIPSLGFKKIQSKNIAQLITQVDTNNIDSSVDNQTKKNLPESTVESEEKKISNSFLLGAIALTSIFTIFLLFLLWQKVELNLSDETSEEVAKKPDNQETTLNAQEKDSLNLENTPENQDYSISQIINSSQNITKTDEQSSEAEQYQDQDTVILRPSQSLEKLDVVEELILKLPISDRQIRQEAITELAQKGDTRAMIPLVKLIKEADLVERNLILETIKQITNNILKTINHALIQSLTDENSPINQNTIRDLNHIYELMSDVTEKLSEVINASEPTVQEATVWSLKQLQQMPVIPTINLESLLKSQD